MDPIERAFDYLVKLGHQLAKVNRRLDSGRAEAHRRASVSARPDPLRIPGRSRPILAASRHDHDTWPPPPARAE